MLAVNYRLLRSAWRLADWAARRLTPGGLLVVAALLLAAVSGIDTELTLAYQLFALLAALLVVGRLGAWRLGGRYRVERHLPRCATVGEPVRYLGVVHNDGTRPCRELALIERTADPRPPIDALRAGLGRLARLSLILAARRWQDLVRRATPVPPRPWPLPEIAPGGRAEVRVEFVPERRGAVRFTGGWLARREPLGLFRALQPFALAQTLLVLPRRYPVPAPALPGQRVYQHGGVTFATGVGDAEEFVGLREYRPGDPLQWIHWKSFARTGRPIVKEFQSEFFERHALVLDTCTVTADERFEEAVSVAASFACTIDTRESLLDLLFVGDRAYCYTAGRGHLQADGLLEVLAHVAPCPGGELAALGHALGAHRARLGGCILVLLGWDVPRRALVDTLRARGLALTCYVVVSAGDASEIAAPGVHRLEVGRVAADLAASGGG